jgi:uncharacterized membrane protein
MDRGPSLSGRLLRQVRNTFVAGLVVVVPVVVTVKGLGWLLGFIDDLARPLAERLAGRPLPGVGLVLTLAVVFAAGLAFSQRPLRRLLEAVDELVGHIPMVGTVYGTSRKVLEGLGGRGGETAFQRFVFARLPGRTTPGFVTGTFTLTRADGSSEPLYAVYVPTNHLYVGDVVVLPAADVIATDLSVEDGVSLILSMGASVPPAVRQPRPR